MLQWHRPNEQRIAGVFSPTELHHLHISTLELVTLTNSLTHFQQRDAHAHLSIYTDSAVVVAVLQRWTTRSQEIYRALQAFLSLI